MTITSKNGTVLRYLVSTDSGIHITELRKDDARELSQMLVPIIPNLQGPEKLQQKLDRNALEIR